MKAMIFAAGLGTRLRPLTDTCPKALVPVSGKPLLQRVIEHLKDHGITEAVINIHYLGEQIREFLQHHQNFGLRIGISDETDRILETGGGLWQARHFFDDGNPFLVCNADILTNIDIRKFRESHEQQDGLATLAVRKRDSSRLLLFDDTGRLCGWKNTKSGELRLPRHADLLNEFAFSGYHIIDPEIFSYPTRTGVFSMTDWYLDLCASHDICQYDHSEDIWIDIGSAERLAQAGELAKRMDHPASL